MRSRFFPILILLFLGLLASAFNIQPVKAIWTDGTITIKADGSIVPSGAPIVTYDNITYSLTDDITISPSDDGIVVERDNIVIDGAGYTVQGAGSDNGIFLPNRCNVTIRNIRIGNFTCGISLYYSSNNNISGNNITDNVYGIYLDYSSNNTITGNNITANDLDGIWLIDSSDNNTITGNNITNNGDGISLDYSSNNTITGNNITNNGDGIYLGSLGSPSDNNTITGNNITDNGLGIFLDYSSNNNISGNNITNNDYDGIYLVSSSDNNISGNDITANNEAGIWLDSSSNNRIFHNNFINNTEQVYIEFFGYANYWDDGYPSGGNYWSDYTDGDVYWGPGQDKPGSDGLGDTPYTIESALNVDHYPLMKAWPSPEITVRVETSTGTGIAEFTPSSGVIVGLEALPEGELPPQGKPDLEFPHGFFSFNVTGLKPGVEVTVTIRLPTALPADSQYWKCQDGLWYEVPLGSNDGDEVVTITLKDGGLGDADGMANGVIVDPGAPGYLKPPVGGVVAPAIVRLIVSFILALAAITIAIILRKQQTT